MLDRAIEEREARARSQERLAAAREDIARILDHRKIALDAAQRARIEACDDLEMLGRWLIRATEIHDAAEPLG